MPKFQLVNPNIDGNLNTSFFAHTPIDAAHIAWNTVSKYITGSVPKFVFTLQKVNGKELSHFVVKEQSSNSSVEFTLEELDSKIPKKVSDKFISKLNAHKQQTAGGDKKSINNNHDDSHDSDDSDDSDNDAIYRKIRKQLHYHHIQPITYWWYTPWLYEVDYMYIPTFIQPLSPYVYLDLFPYNYLSTYFN